MNEKTILSVIIPCYNGYKYMNNCLTSFEKQTRKDFELVVVDDASTDGSYSSLEKYVSQSQMRITLIKNQRNLGPGQSRKIAMEHCSSKYIGFCDCDDWVDPKYVEEVVELMDHNSADFCMFNNYRVNKDKLFLDDVTAPLKKAQSINEIIAYAPMSLCRIVADSELIKKVDFYELYYGEDGIVLTQLLIKAKNIIFSSTPYYYYLMRESSAHAKPSKRCFKDAVKKYEYLKKYMQEKYYDEMVYIGIRHLIYSGTIQGFKAGVDEKEIKQAIKMFKRENPKYILNKYFNSLIVAKRLYVILIYNNLLFAAKILTHFHTILMGRSTRR